jgi:hypothetical protein
MDKKRSNAVVARTKLFLDGQDILIASKKTSRKDETLLDIVLNGFHHKNDFSNPRDICLNCFSQMTCLNPKDHFFIFGNCELKRCDEVIPWDP